jgi:hypothetical protein
VGARSVSATATGFVTSQRSVTVLGNATVPLDIDLSPRRDPSQAGSSTRRRRRRLVESKLSFCHSHSLSALQTRVVTTHSATSIPALRLSWRRSPAITRRSWSSTWQPIRHRQRILQ